MKSVLDRIPDLSVEMLDTGCCGMAGSFGYEKEHYELSLKIGEDRLFQAVREVMLPVIRRAKPPKRAALSMLITLKAASRTMARVITPAMVAREVR